MRKVLLFSGLLAGILLAVMGGPGCANIIPPEGGPRDSIAPVLVEASPADSTTNFRGDHITLEFDEFLGDLQDIQSNLLFTPLFQTNPRIELRRNIITIRFRDSLEANTTYVLNFGNAIRDNNEGNVLRNFVYTFSTGPVLDSLELRGKVVMAENAKVDSTLIVVLHRNLDDSAVVKERPRYVARLDRNGNFRFQNLPPGTFKIYALGDAGITRRYQNPGQAFAFADSAVTIGTTNNLTLYAYRENAATTPATAPKGTIPIDRRLRWTTNLTNNLQDLQKDLVINFTTPLGTYDSSRISLTSDSTFNRVDHQVILDTSRKEIRITTNWRENTRYNLILEKEFGEDTARRRLFKTDTVSFTTRKIADYGKLAIRMRNIDLNRNPVLLFIQNEQVVHSAPIASGVYSSSLFNPGEYELRILYDTNGNGKWDPGSFFGEKRQPEIVRPVEQKIIVKPNWENEFERGL